MDINWLYLKFAISLYVFFDTFIGLLSMSRKSESVLSYFLMGLTSIASIYFTVDFGIQIFR